MDDRAIGYRGLQSALPGSLPDSLRFSACLAPGSWITRIAGTAACALATRAAPRHNRPMTPFPAIILAGGRATRMGGGDKCLLDLGGRTMLARIIGRLAPQCNPLALNANGDPARFAGFGLTVLPDSLPDFPGPLAGILAGMDWAAGLGADRVVSVAGDTPFFPCDLAQRLMQAGGGIVLAASRDAAGRDTDHPTFGLWPIALRDDLRACLDRGERRVRGFAQAHGAVAAAWDAGPLDPFFNINTPEDLDRAQSFI